MFLIAEKDIQKHYLMNDAIKDVRIGLFSKKKELVKNPNRTVIEYPKHNASSLYMPSVDLANEIASIKIASIFREMLN